MAVEMEQIREALVVNLKTVSAKQVNAYRMTNPTMPALLVVGFDEITATTFSGGGSTGYSIPMLVQGLAGTPLDKIAQQTLDKWISPLGDDSVWEAIESDSTLGGIVDDLAVTGCDGSQFFTLDNGTVVLGSTWHVQIEI